MLRPAWLSHHGPEERHRCYLWGRVHVCARCLGLYPVLLAAVAGQFAAGAPLDHPVDLWLGVGLLLPALADWAAGRLLQRPGSNAWRTATGALLGLALGRSLFIHIQRPFPRLLVLQGILVTAVLFAVILTSWVRRRRA